MRKVTYIANGKETTNYAEVQGINHKTVLTEVEPTETAEQAEKRKARVKKIAEKFGIRG